jgi:hypothetical protein
MLRKACVGLLEFGFTIGAHRADNINKSRGSMFAQILVLSFVCTYVAFKVFLAL